MTKAVRSKDLDKERWDLISNIAIKKLEDTFVRSGAVFGLTDYMLQKIYSRIIGYLWGEREKDSLVIAMHDLCVVAQKELCDGCCAYKEGIPYHALQALAQTCNEGAIKYGDHNWLYGFPIYDLLNHTLAHIARYRSGNREENHIGHALWGLMASIHMEETRPDMCKWLLGLNGTITEELHLRLQEHRNAKA